QVVDCQVMCDKIAAAVSAKHDPDLLIIARTDARAVEGIEGAIERAKAYQDAGADAIFPEALESVEDFERFARSFKNSRIPLIANMTEWGKTPLLSVNEFSQLGYRIVLFPMTMFRLMAKSMEMGLMELQSQGTQKELLDLMQPRSELYRVLRYEAYNDVDGVREH
ncbi:MAG: isocitrate lyase/phosphoenolpyruvate mutase family protein, partial [Nitrospirota bacterium]|nr:isocitrate lyase/phosphoenolpyruvate mutase family protein [Nitrospirota bacterium]